MASEVAWPHLWQADWIWPAVPETTQDTIALCRQVFELAVVPSSVPCRVTADGRYQLWANGTRVGRGPVRSEPAWLTYDSYDLAELLVPGRNVIGLLCRHYGTPVLYWKPAVPVAGLGRGGVLFEARFGEELLVSDDTWQGRFVGSSADRPNPRFGPPATETHDGREWPQRWSTVEADEAGWAPVVDLLTAGLGITRRQAPTEPFGLLGPAALSPLQEQDVDPQQLLAQDGASVTADFGRILNGHPVLTVDAPAGTVVELTGGEDLDERGVPVAAPRNWALRYTVGGHPGETVESLEPVGLRYLRATATAGRLSLSMRERHYPRPASAAFSCDDPFLTALWQAGAATLDACSTDAFLDCPGREQRAWVGDAYLESLLSLVCNPDTRLVRWSIQLTGQGVRADGLRPMVAASDLTDFTTIPDFSLHWVRTLARVHDHLGDVELVEQLLPRALDACAWFERHRGPDGLLTDLSGWLFVDWAQTERGRQTAAVDALYALTLDDLALLAAAIGDDGTARRARDRADRTRAAFERYWDAGRGVYVDAADPQGTRSHRVSQQTNSLAILSGAAPADRWAGLLDWTLDGARRRVTSTPADLDSPAGSLGRQDEAPENFDEQLHVVAAQPYFQHFVHQAMAMAGRVDGLFDSFRLWEPLLARGNGVLEEHWDAPPGRASRCHAWSATPTYDLTTHVAGVRPAAPGCSSIEIRPYLGPLGQVAADVPIPQGTVHLRLNRGGVSHVELPAGVTGSYHLAHHEPLTLRPGRQEIRCP